MQARYQNFTFLMCIVLYNIECDNRGVDGDKWCTMHQFYDGTDRKSSTYTCMHEALVNYASMFQIIVSAEYNVHNVSYRSWQITVLFYTLSHNEHRNVTDTGVTHCVVGVTGS